MPAVQDSRRTYEEISVKKIVKPVSVLEGLSIPEHDFLELSYTGTDLTGVVYRRGGASGAIVATLALTYSGGNLLTVAKT
jgi:hypothetical protein